MSERGGHLAVDLAEPETASDDRIDRLSFRTHHTGRPRILVVGGEDHQLRIPFLAALCDEGFDVSAAGGGERSAFESAGITLYPYGYERFIGPISDVLAIARLRHIVRTAAPDIVQTFDTKPGVVAPLALGLRRRPRIVRTINGLGWVFSSSSTLARLLRPVFDVAHRATAGRVAQTVFQNTHDMRHFAERRMAGPGGGALIPGSGIDPDALRATARRGPPPNELRAALGIGAAPVVLTVTRLARVKGVATLLEAAARVHRRRPDVRFLLVGSRETEGRDAIAAEELSRHVDYVIATGPRRDVAALLAAADVFAFPTELLEGVPRVLLEAAAMSVPIVTTPMPGCADVVEDGVTGTIVPVRDPARLADAILAMLAAPDAAAAMANRARSRVDGDFSLKAITARYATLYRLVLATTAPKRSGRR